jgi:hypothetical protein
VLGFIGDFSIFNFYRSARELLKPNAFVVFLSRKSALNPSKILNSCTPCNSLYLPKLYGIFYQNTKGKQKELKLSELASSEIRQGFFTPQALERKGSREKFLYIRKYSVKYQNQLRQQK